jgi:hypothetical protein
MARAYRAKGYDIARSAKAANVHSKVRLSLKDCRHGRAEKP